MGPQPEQTCAGISFHFGFFDWPYLSQITQISLSGARGLDSNEQNSWKKGETQSGISFINF